MSKSYKRFPVVKQEKVNKHVWNRKVRHGKRSKRLGIMSNGEFKKVTKNFDTWQYRWTLKQAIKNYSDYEREMTLEEWIEYWKRICVRK